MNNNNNIIITIKNLKIPFFVQSQLECFERIHTHRGTLPPHLTQIEF